MPPLVDTHAHLTDAAFANDLPGVISRSRAAGLVQINVIGFDAATSVAACGIADTFPDMVLASVGIQPNSVSEAAAGDWDAVERLARSHSRVAALGETGLDRYWDDTPIELQRDYFERHIALSRETGLPLVIHLRESGPEIVDQLQPWAASGSIRGVMHSFTGDLQTCRDCLDMGLFISFAGMITFKKSDELRSIAAYVPADRLLVETDSPYLSPEPFRGKRPNEPARVRHTLAAIAAVRGVAVAELAVQTTANAWSLFGTPRP